MKKILLLISLFFCASYARADGYVQSISSAPIGFSNTTAAQTWTPATGNMIVCGVLWGNNSVASISDSVNSWTGYGTCGSASGSTELFVAWNITGGAETVTVTLGTASNIGFSCHEVAGRLKTDPRDGSACQTQTSPGTGADKANSGTTTPSSANDYVYGISFNRNGDNASFTAGTGYVIKNAITTWGADETLSTNNGIKTDTTAQAATFGIGGNGADIYLTEVGMFKPVFVPSNRGMSIQGGKVSVQ